MSLDNRVGSSGRREVAYASESVWVKSVHWIAVALAMSALAAGCNSIDPTEQFFAIGFRNDGQRSLMLRACGDSQCQHFTDSWQVKPGATVQDNVSDRGVRTWWLVASVSGRRLGCLPLIFHAKYRDVAVRLLQAVSCGPHAALGVSQLVHGPRLSGQT